MRLLASLLVWLLRAALVTRGSLVLENLALRQQLATLAPRSGLDSSLRSECSGWRYRGSGRAGARRC